MKFGIGNDHIAYDLKQIIKDHLESKGHEVVDFGHHSTTRTDYPIFGRAVGEAVAKGDVERGILMCGSGVGISIAANKVSGVRCVCCSEPYSALLSRQHNNTNVLAFGSRVVGDDLAKMIVDCWVGGDFEGGRHADRVALLSAMETERLSR